MEVLLRDLTRLILNNANIQTISTRIMEQMKTTGVDLPSLQQKARERNIPLFLFAYPFNDAVSDALIIGPNGESKKAKHALWVSTRVHPILRYIPAGWFVAWELAWLIDQKVHYPQTRSYAQNLEMLSDTGFLTFRGEEDSDQRARSLIGSILSMPSGSHLQIVAEDELKLIEAYLDTHPLLVQAIRNKRVSFGPDRTGQPPNLD